jgi:hypothetical protein
MNSDTIAILASAIVLLVGAYLKDGDLDQHPARDGTRRKLFEARKKGLCTLTPTRAATETL